MSIKLGLYDFFAYTLPGGLYLSVVAYGAAIFGLIVIDLNSLGTLSFVQIVILVAVAYFISFVFDPFAKYWHRLFKGGKGYTRRVYDNYTSSHAAFEFKLPPDDWPVMLAYIRRENIEIAGDIERLNVSRIMMRNVSLGLAFLTVLQSIQCLRTNFLPLDAALLIVFAAGSVLCGRQGATFQAWFYQSLYQAILARSLTISDLVILRPVVSTADNKEQTSTQPAESHPASPK
jgi:hypothetical protein